MIQDNEIYENLKIYCWKSITSYFRGGRTEFELA